jgi:hypothetical protein
LVIQVNDILKDAAVDDPVRAPLLLFLLLNLLVHVNTSAQKPPI